VHQGDQLSPILFDFLVDGLAAILAKAKQAGHIEGAVDHIIPGGVSHLQYADDTMVLRICQVSRSTLTRAMR
jgi:hypothetical protein